MITSWFGKYTFNENFKRGDRQREKRRKERETEREREREREKVNIYIQAENREKGKGERHGMKHESGIQRTSNVF